MSYFKRFGNENITIEIAEEEPYFWVSYHTTSGENFGNECFYTLLEAEEYAHNLLHNDFSIYYVKQWLTICDGGIAFEKLTNTYLCDTLEEAKTLRRELELASLTDLEMGEPEYNYTIDNVYEEVY